MYNKALFVLLFGYLNKHSRSKHTIFHFILTKNNICPIFSFLFILTHSTYIFTKNIRFWEQHTIGNCFMAQTVSSLKLGQLKKNTPDQYLIKIPPPQYSPKKGGKKRYQSWYTQFSWESGKLGIYTLQYPPPLRYS